MKLLMIKSIVMEGVARFLEQYPKKVYSSKSKYSGTRRLGEMRDKVAALNLDKLCKELGDRGMRDAVEEVLDKSWTRVECDECQCDIVVGMELGKKELGADAVRVCQTCLNRAAVGLQKAVIMA